jgi:hypothetical protein
MEVGLVEFSSSQPDCKYISKRKGKQEIFNNSEFRIIKSEWNGYGRQIELLLK